jgi:serine/threonine-protein kinase
LQVGKWLGQIGSALQHAYSLGILHRDLNPRNIIVINGGQADETIKVKNFGLTQLTVAPHLPLEAFHGQIRPGTACHEYMCPEQALGEEMDQRGDIYSLGVMLFQLLTGVHPFPCTTAEEYREAHAHTLPPKFAAVGVVDVPRAIEDLVQRCLFKYNAWRPWDALQLVRLFERALGEPIAVDAEMPEDVTISPSGVFRAFPPGAIIYRLEGWMPESIAVIKLQGFVKSAEGQVVDSIPGLVRIRLLHPQSPPPVKQKSGIFKILGQQKIPEQSPWIINLEVHMEKKDPARPNLLDISLLLYSPNDNLARNRGAVKHCEQLCKEVSSFLMAKPVDS